MNGRALAAAILILTASAVPARAWEPLAYPGSTWGNVGRDLSGFDGNFTSGFVQQGVDWFALPGKLVFDTYGGYSWRARTSNQQFFDVNGPYAGASLSRGPFKVGGEYAAQTYPLLDQTTHDYILYGSVYKSADLSPWTGLPSWDAHKALAVPATVWARVEKDFNGIEGFGSIGWVEQGVDWTKLPGGVTFETFGAFRWILRSLNDQYYDEYGPALGVQLKRGPLDLDLEYAWRYYPHLREYQNGPQIFLTWYFDWDLAKLRR
jgi:hypothetical protein